MPSLFVLFIFLIFRSVSLPGAGAGLSYIFKPDWSVVSGQTFLAALGQAFFSLSLGMGCMITYGSYLNKKENLPSNALTVVSMDTAVALMAAIAIFRHSLPLREPAAGPGLVFVVVHRYLHRWAVWGCCSR